MKVISGKAMCRLLEQRGWLSHASTAHTTSIVIPRPNDERSFPYMPIRISSPALNAASCVARD